MAWRKIEEFFFFLEIWKIFYIEISEERPVLLCFWPDRSCPLKNGKVTLLTSPKQVCAKAFDCVDHNKLWKILKEGSGWGTHVYLWRIHFDTWQN